jgi:hypothetical protein
MIVSESSSARSTLALTRQHSAVDIAVVDRVVKIAQFVDEQIRAPVGEGGGARRNGPDRNEARPSKGGRVVRCEIGNRSAVAGDCERLSALNAPHDLAAVVA